MRLTQRLEDMGIDMRFAVRQLISAPGFTLVAALTLALGIGVNSAIFSLADAALMRPLPFGEPDRLVMLWERTPTSPRTGVSPLNMRDWSLQSRSFEGIAFVQRGMGGGPLLTAPDGTIETAERQSTSANFFDVLKVVPIVGRTFKPEDEGPSPRVVLLGEAVWRRRFSSDPTIVGRLVRLNGQPYTVVGVVGDTVQFSRPAEIWTLTGQIEDVPINRAGRAFDVVARLKPGVAIETADAELSIIADQLARAYPEQNKGAGVIVEPLRAGIIGSDLAATSVFLLGGGDTGYRARSESILTLDFSVPTGKASRYPSQEAVTQFYDAVARDVSALPEVRRVGWASSLPYGTSELGRWAFEIIGDPQVDARDRPSAEFTTADPGYFNALDLPIVSGRGFNDRDSLHSVPVCLVNEAFVRRHFEGRNPIGARLALTPPLNRPGQIREIVGVARQTSGQPDAPDELLQVYVPLAQFPTGDVYMVVQPSAGAAETLTPLVRRVVARIDPDVPVRRDRTLETLSVESTAGYRFRAEIVGAFAALALVLAMVGVFGVLAYTVQQRQREIGVRMALGATSLRVTWLVLRDAGWMIAIGAVSGMVLAGLSGRLVAAFLFGVDPLDPLTFVSVPVVILVTAIAAAAAPAWHASRINPVDAFRHDG